MLYYPDITDDDVNKLITFFKLSAKAVYATKKAEIRLSDTDVIKSDICKK